MFVPKGTNRNCSVGIYLGIFSLQPNCKPILISLLRELGEAMVHICPNLVIRGGQSFLHNGVVDKLFMLMGLEKILHIEGGTNISCWSLSWLR